MTVAGGQAQEAGQRKTCKAQPRPADTPAVLGGAGTARHVAAIRDHGIIGAEGAALSATETITGPRGLTRPRIPPSPGSWQATLACLWSGMPST